MAQLMTTVTREITADEVKSCFLDVVMENAPWDQSEMEITDIRVYPERIKAPAGEISYDVDMPSNCRYLGKVSSLVTIKVNGTAIRRVHVSGHVEVSRDVFCATHTIRRGDVIRIPGDVELVKRPLSRLRGAAITDLDLINGYVASRSIRPGQVITEDLVEAPMLVERGKRVMIVAESPYINIRTPGIVLQDGAAGELVAVKNIMSKRKVTAMVVDRRTVKVLF